MSDATVEDLPLGTLVADRFLVKAKLGEGGMGAVYVAEQQRLGRKVALKLILPEHAARKGARDRFEREARTASALRHRGAVEIYDFGDFRDTLYLAMELLRGYPLRDVVDLDLPVLPLERTLNYARQIAAVLAAAADIGLVHRDLKPENVMIEPGRDGGERVVVVDFGLAFMTEREDAGRMTREGVVTGTPDYMSPEQARGAEIGPPTDVYSFGAMLYEMLTAHPPFEGDTAILISRHLFVAPTPIREAYPDVDIPGVLDDLVQRMLEKDPAARPTAQAVLDALEGIDPSAPKRHGASAGGKLVGRAARMVSQHPPPTQTGATEFDVEAAAPLVASTDVGLVGELPEELLVGLAANGLRLHTDREPTDPRLRAIFAPGCTPETLAELAASGRPIITDADAGDMDRLSAMLRAGAAEVVVRPIGPEEVARKTLRAIRKYERKR